MDERAKDANGIVLNESDYCGDLKLYECFQGFGYTRLSEMLMNGSGMVRGSKLEWKESNFERDCTTLAEDYVAGSGAFTIVDNYNGAVVGGTVYIDGCIQAYDIVAVWPNTITVIKDGEVQVHNDDDKDIAAGTKVTVKNPLGTCVCPEERCVSTPPELVYNYVETFRSCVMGTNKMDELDNKYGKFAWRKDRSILAQNAEEQLLNLTLQIDEAAYKGVRKQSFDKNGKAVGMMGGKMFFIHEAQKKHPEICIDASSEATGDYPWIKNGVFQNPSVAQVLNFAIASAKACGGGNFDTILINPLDATAWAETTQCKDFCNVSPMDTNAGSAGKTTFSTNVPGFMGRRMKIEALEIIPRGEILIGDSSSCELLPVEGCPMEFVELTNYDPRCPDYVIDVSLSMRVTNPKCNWRRIKNLVIC